MNVSLTPQLEKLVNQKVKTGMYQTASEVVREALRLLRDRDEEFARLKADVLKGFEEIERGDYEEYDERTSKKLIEDVKRRGRARLAAANRSPTKA